MTGLILTLPDGTQYQLTGDLKATAANQPEQPPIEQPPETEPPPEQPPAAGLFDFRADFNAFAANTNLLTAEDWKKLWKQAIDQGSPKVVCLEQNSDATRHDFWIRSGGPTGGNYLSAFMPRDSFGMGHRSCQVWLGKAKIVNVSFRWRVKDPGVNLWTEGGGKWGGAINWGPITTSPGGGLRNFAIWPAGASSLGHQDIVVGLQDQRDAPNSGKQWVQPVYNGFRPIQYGHWYEIHMRMTGAPASDKGKVRIEYWKDADPKFDFTARTDNFNAQAGVADVFYDLTCFFGGGAANAAPKDCWFDFGDIRVWTEDA